MRRLSQALLLSATFNISLAVQTTTEGNKDDTATDRATPCRIWLDRSVYNPNSLGLFVGSTVAQGEEIPGQQEGDVILPVFDADFNEEAWSRWYDLLFGLPNDFISDDLLWQSAFAKHAIIPGIASMAQCDDEEANAAVTSKDLGSHQHLHTDDMENSFGVHRSENPEAGSFSYRSVSSSSSFAAREMLPVGQEIILSCHYNKEETTLHLDKDSEASSSTQISTDTAICLDTLYVQPSKVVPGRGAFSRRHFSKGDRVTTSPVALLHRSDLYVDNILFSNAEISHEHLLKNYVFGHENSSVLILPYGLGVNGINHAVSAEEANVRISWSDSELSDSSILEKSVLEALVYEGGHLLIDFIALKDIAPGDEILIDYGPEWSKAWNEHKKDWELPPKSKTYLSAEKYRHHYADHIFQTVGDSETGGSVEAEKAAFPENLMTMCYHKQSYEDGFEDGGCLWPCTILQRLANENETIYKVRFDWIEEDLFYSYCDSEIDFDEKLNLPRKEIRLVDKPYTTDLFLPDAFRQEMDLPRQMIPEQWLKVKNSQQGDFYVPPKMSHGQIEHIKWKDDNEVVTPNGYLLGISPSTHETLLKYAEDLGVVELSRDVTFRGNGLPLGEEKEISLKNMSWLLQATDGKYHSDMHWISPLNGDSQQSFLQALSLAGFDEILASIGQHFGFQSLVCYSLTFIAVSSCNKGFLHHDSAFTADDSDSSRVFNIIVPLLLNNDTEPELEIRSAADGTVGRLRYQYNLAAMMGDLAVHATAEAHYKDQVRLAATIYIADVDEHNVEAVMRSITQSYPPADRPDILLGMAGSHWNPSDPVAKLPSKHTTESWQKRLRHNPFTIMLVLSTLLLAVACDRVGRWRM